MIRAVKRLNPFRNWRGFFVLAGLIAGVSVPSFTQSEPVETFLVGHSHNDYTRKNPLTDALSARMRSIEADVHLIKGELYVSHIRPLFRRPSRTLRQLYLEPLFELFTVQGFVYPDEPLLLLIDIKTDAEATYAVLDEQLKTFEEMLYTWEEGKASASAVKVVISGNRPVEQLRSAAFRRAALDGRLSDFNAPIDPELTPMISTSARSLRSIRPARAREPEKIVEELRIYAEQANAAGAYFRVWGAPDRDWFWELALEAGIELVNTDKPSAFRNFVENRRSR